jgi:predicted DsbA family dithiol-disulfide isomerase/uncharacterized membrane protein
LRIALWLVVLRIAALVALGVSSALLVDYMSFSPAFCSPGSGCSAVRGSGWGYLFGGKLPVPAIGIAGFAGLFSVSLSRGLKPWVFPMAAFGGVAAAFFIVLQAAVIREFCLLCVIVDVAGIIAAIAAYLHKRGEATGATRDPFAPWAWALFSVAAVATPLSWPSLRPQAPVPAGILSYYQPGKINVVEFADYECPFCRALHPQLKKLVKEREGQVNFVRLNMPLPRHESALDAAKAAVCADAQGKGDEMADQLFEIEDLSATSLRRMAVKIRLDPRAFDLCFASPATLERIQREGKILRDAGFQGLPTTYVGARQIVGAQGEEIFREAFDQAARGDAGNGIPGGIFAAIIAAAVGAVAFLGRRDEHDGQDEPPAPRKKPEPSSSDDGDDDIEAGDTEDGDTEDDDDERGRGGDDDAGSSDGGGSDAGSSDSGSSDGGGGSSDSGGSSSSND